MQNPVRVLISYSHDSDAHRERIRDLAARLRADGLDAHRSTSPGKALHAVEADGYFFEHVARHVRDGEGTAALRALLFDHRWPATNGTSAAKQGER